MNHSPTYVILGSGRQGTAAGYDMAHWGGAGTVVCADADLGAAQSAARRINYLTGREVARAVQIDVQDQDALVSLLQGSDACLSAVPYRFNLDVTRAAVAAGVHLCDLGGHTGIARQQHEFDAQARQKGVSIVPNCGQVPGMGTTLMVWAMEMLDETTDIFMWDCGLPQKPRPPFNYMMTFHIAGLTNEYAEPGIFLRDGKITEVESMSEVELVEFPEPIGVLEGVVTGGGLDTMPWTYEGKLRTLQNLTLRYPGTSAQLKAYKDLGLWDLEPIDVNGQSVVPRDVFHALFAPKVTFPDDKDLIIIRIRAVGMKDSQPAEVWVDLIDYYDEATGFTAMERGTGFSAAIVAEMMVRGETPRGAGGVEVMVPPEPFVAELRKRNFNVEHRLELK
jgi:lysine 6-dehydrogenase